MIETLRRQLFSYDGDLKVISYTYNCQVTYTVVYALVQRCNITIEKEKKIMLGTKFWILRICLFWYTLYGTIINFVLIKEQTLHFY